MGQLMHVDLEEPSVADGGIQCAADVYRCNTMPLVTAARLRQLIEYYGGEIISFTFREVEPKGSGGFISMCLMPDSHVAVRTWPTEKYASMDAYTCGIRVDPVNMLKSIAANLGAESADFILTSRGPFINRDDGQYATATFSYDELQSGSTPSPDESATPGAVRSWFANS
jgi:S-adenosylmethionine decarboxylase